MDEPTEPLDTLPPKRAGGFTAPLLDAEERAALALRTRSLRIAQGIGLVSIYSGILFQIAWWLGLPRLASPISNFAPVRPLASLCVLLYGIAIYYKARHRLRQAPGKAPLAARGLAFVGAVIAALSLLEWLPGARLGISQFVGHRFAGLPILADPRVPAVIGLCLLLEGFALTFLGAPGFLRRAARGAAGIAGLTSLVVILGQANGPGAANPIGIFGQVALLGPIWIAALTVAAFLGTPDEGIGKVIASPLYGGHMARRILPIAVLVPLIAGFARILNQIWGILPPELLSLLLGGAFIFGMWTVVVLNAQSLNAMDGQRRQVGHRNASIATIVDSTLDAILSVNMQGQIESWNRGAQSMFGYTEAEAINQSVAILAPPDRVEELRNMLERLSEGERIENVETVRRRKDGSAFEVNLTVAPIRQEGGVITGFSAVVRDLTKLRDYERRFRTVVESAPIAMIVVDGKGNVVLINRLTRSLFGYDQAELVGASVEKLIPRRFASSHGTLRNGYFQDPEVRQMGEGRDLFALRKDGSEFPVEIGLNPIETPEGTLTLAAIADITERKRASEELQAYAQELKRSNDELEQFAYVASHDLQEPLRMVVSYMDLLQDRYKGQLDERADKYIHYAVDGSRRMQRLVQDLLTVSRVSSQAKPLAPTSSESVLTWVLRSLNQTIRESGAVITHGSLPTVMADEVQLGQVFQNLISNAIKFRSDESPKIQIEASMEGDMWEFRISDNGIGIEEQYHERIFQMFQRLHERGKFEGSGIGLSVSRKIVERHGGMLYVAKNQPGETGTTFVFTLPGVDEG